MTTAVVGVGEIGEWVANWAIDRARQRADAECELVDL